MAFIIENKGSSSVNSHSLSFQTNDQQLQVPPCDQLQSFPQPSFGFSQSGWRRNNGNYSKLGKVSFPSNSIVLLNNQSEIEKHGIK